jgi:hypothetical protein
MSRLTIAAQTLDGAYPALPYDAGAADLSFTATDDQTDRETPLVDNKTVVLAMNTDESAHTITIHSVADQFNRVGDIAAYSVDPGKVARFGPFKTSGWAASAKLLIDVSNATLRLAVVTLP